MIKTVAGAPLAGIEETDRRLVLTIDRLQNRAFADHLVQQLPALFEAFLAEEGNPGGR